MKARHWRCDGEKAKHYAFVGDTFSEVLDAVAGFVSDKEAKDRDFYFNLIGPVDIDDGFAATLYVLRSK